MPNWFSYIKLRFFEWEASLTDISFNRQVVSIFNAYGVTWPDSSF